MEEITKSLIFAILLIFIMSVFGVIAYHNLEGWGWVDCIYFMSTTFTTLGYGDIVPKTDEGKIFTVFFMWTGISIGFYLIYTISKYREEKIDHRIFPFISNIMEGGTKTASNKKTNLHGEPLKIPPNLGQLVPSTRPHSKSRHTRDLRNIINPARPHSKSPPKKKYKK